MLNYSKITVKKRMHTFMKNYFNLNGIPKIEHKTIKYKRNQFLTRKNAIELIFTESFMAS